MNRDAELLNAERSAGHQETLNDVASLGTVEGGPKRRHSENALVSANSTAFVYDAARTNKNWEVSESYEKIS